MRGSPDDITALLDQVRCGDGRAADRLFPAVYDELRRLAESRLRQERPDHTLQATALVHEAYLKLIDQTRVQWQSQAHFFAVAAEAIRRILVDHARLHRVEKRGGDRQRIALDARDVAPERDSTDLVALHEAMERLAVSHPDKVRVVELRFFGGLTHEEIAEVMGVNSRTVERHWQFARSWLYREIADDE